MVIQRNIDDTAKKLFCVFAYLTLLLVVAAFASIVASTFAITPVPVDASNARSGGSRYERCEFAHGYDFDPIRGGCDHLWYRHAWP